MAHKITLVPCSGNCPEGQITRIAAQELVLEQKAEWCQSWQQLDKNLDTSAEESAPFIIIDGCEEQCLFNELLEDGLVGKHHLALSDIGIAPRQYDDISREDIELAKEAIIVECKPAKPSIPPLFSGCCCG